MTTKLDQLLEWDENNDATLILHEPLAHALNRAIGARFTEQQLSPKIQDGSSSHLENRKIAIPQPRFERFRHNLARLCSSTLLTIPTVYSKFGKSKIMAAAGRLVNASTDISPPRFEPF